MVLLAAVLLAVACMPYGFVGGGLPANIRTVAVIPLDNQTSSPELQGEVTDALRAGMERRLGLRSAAESRADALLRGRIVSFEAGMPVSYSSDPSVATSARRRLQMVVDLEIVDQSNSKVLWAQRGLSVQADYAEGAEAQGRRTAVEKLVNTVIEGAQSQW